MGARERSFDLVLAGATGYTGRLVAAFLARHAGPLRWALAGRDRARLDAVRREVAPAAGVLVADLHDPAQAAALARDAHVIATTVGPYLEHGRALVAACAAHGTDYGDLTAEIPFMRETIDLHDDTARRSGARIVHACGFDSIPSDLGVAALRERAERGGDRLVCAHLRVLRARGGFSGGTAASLRAIGAAAHDPAVRRLLADPHALDPRDPREPRDPHDPREPRDPHDPREPRDRRGDDAGAAPDRRAPRRDPETGRWFAPFVMAPMNTRVVRRSNALAGFPCGRDFRYEESVDAGRGLRGAITAAAIAAVTAGAGALALRRAGRALLARFMPEPGSGPSPEQRARGMFEILVTGTTAGGSRLRCRIGAALDPGYGATAVMLGESALHLAATRGTAPGGVLTPATALGLPLVARLRAAGFRFDVEE